MAKHRRYLSNALVIREIMRDPTLNKNEKIVGVAIASRRSLDTLVCCPSQETICIDCCIKDPKQVRDAINVLEEKSYLTVTKNRYEQSQWDHNQYYFKRDWAAQRALAKSPDFKGDRTLFGFTDVSEKE